MPDEEEVRKIRVERLNNLLDKCRYNLPELPILIVAQNWKGNEIPVKGNLTVFNYGKLGITKARDTLRKMFLDTRYDYMICFDDDFEINKSPISFSKYIKILNTIPNAFIEYENYIMNLCAMSRYIAERYPFDESISAETGTGFEDWIYVSVIKNSDKEHYYNVRNLNLATRPRSELVNDKYSTWQNESVNKEDINQKSSQIIKEKTLKNIIRNKSSLPDKEYIF